MLIENRIHRLPVIDPETGDLFAILNQKPLLKFLFNIPKVRTLTGLSESIEEAGVGSYDNISVSVSTLVVYLFDSNQTLFSDGQQRHQSNRGSQQTCE